MRAVACDPEDVIVTAGAQQAFDLLARVLVTSERRKVAVEDPGYSPLRLAFTSVEADLLPIAVDEHGLRTSDLPVSSSIVCVTPSHQFPTGVVMSRERRIELLEFAKGRNAVVIEDDYDAEFRFGPTPVDALRTLDRSECVFYVGTFSKSMFPGLRLGFIVAPPWARSALTAARQAMDWHSPAASQLALASFIREGHLARHIRKMRRLYALRRARIINAIGPGGRLRLLPSAAGLHVGATLRSGKPLDDVILGAWELGGGSGSTDGNDPPVR
jgi:GntR family transcriptional regulator/MocR family aminotransferase